MLGLNGGCDAALGCGKAPYKGQGDSVQPHHHAKCPSKYSRLVICYFRNLNTQKKIRIGCFCFFVSPPKVDGEPPACEKAIKRIEKGSKASYHLGWQGE